MKKIIAITLIASALLAGCSAPNTSTTNGSTTQQGQMSASYKNGTYRGAYINSDEVEVEFVLTDNKFESVKFRKLGFGGNDYLKSEDKSQIAVKTQYEELSNYLLGKDISTIDELYVPENIAKDIDTMTAATVRSSKLISAINDALGRGPYKLA